MRLRFVVLFIIIVISNSVFAQDIQPLVFAFVLRWSPNGEQLLITGRSDPDVWGLWVYDASLRPLRFFMLGTTSGSLISPSWNPQGTRFAINRDVVDATTLEPIFTLKADSNIGAWSQDGSLLLAWADETHLGLFDADTGDLVRKIPAGKERPEALSWSPNNEYFLFVNESGISEIRSASDGRVLRILEGEYGMGLSWSADSRYLAGSLTTSVEPGTPGTLPFALSPIIASVNIWDAASGKIIRTFSGLSAAPSLLRWHPHKPELTAAAPEGVIYVWNIETGEQIYGFTSEININSLTYSPSGGTWLVSGSPRPQTVEEETKGVYPQEAYWTRDIIANTLQVIVIDPSVEKLREIETTCRLVASPSLLSATDIVAADTAQIRSYIDAVKAAATIPPACAADLIAVAEALSIP